MTAKHVKKGKFEYIYVEGFTTYASVHKPKKGYENKGLEYSLNLFITKEDVDILEETLINKTFFKVGIDKNKKKKIKFPLETHEEYEGLYGFNVSRPFKSKDGKKAYITVIDKDRKPFKQMLGNGSKIKIKCYGWRNAEDLLSVALDTIQVLEFVPYEANNEFEDDEFGGSYERRTSSALEDDDSDGHEEFGEEDYEGEADEDSLEKSDSNSDSGVKEDDTEGGKY